MQARAEEAARASGASEPRAGGSNRQEEGYWAYMQRQLNERTEKLNVIGDSVDRLGEQSAGWANDVNKFVSNQKKNMLMGGESTSLVLFFPTLTRCAVLRAGVSWLFAYSNADACFSTLAVKSKFGF